jgi:4-hydroxybenzoate polyprenyltransferase
VALAFDLLRLGLLGLRWWFVGGVGVAAAIALYHYTLIRDATGCAASTPSATTTGWVRHYFGVALDALG